MAKKQKYLLPILALIMANVLWGINTPLIKMGVDSMPVPIFTSIRFLGVSLLVLPFAIRSWKPLRRRELLLFILSSVISIVLSSYVMNLGLSKTTAFDASIIWLTQPIILFLLSARFLQERMNLRTFIGILVALAGSLVIVGRPEISSMDNMVGNLYIVISVFCSAIHTIICKPLMQKVSGAQATFLGSFPGIVPVTILALTQLGSWEVRATTSRSWWAMIMSTLFVALANFLFYYGLTRKKARDTGVYQYVDPVVAITAAWFLLAERPTPTFAAGAILVAAGVYVVESRVKMLRSKQGLRFVRR